jgi:hypothetical protein
VESRLFLELLSMTSSIELFVERERTGVHFYRRIAIPRRRVSGVIADIRGRGLLPTDGFWRMDFNDLKPQIAELRQRPVVTTADTKFKSEKPSWVCACSDEIGAIYYATEHNRTKEDDVPILIRFDASVRDVIIDGRDFLYKLFQLGEPQRARPVAEGSRAMAPPSRGLSLQHRGD